MARLLTWGAEENAIDLIQVIASGTPVLISTAGVPHSGTYCQQVGAAATHEGRNTASAVTSGTFFWRGYLRVPAYPTNNAAGECVNSGNQSGAYISAVAINMTTVGRLQLWNMLTGPTVSADTSILALDTWYRVELRHLVSDTVGELQMKLYLGDSLTALDDVSTPVGDTLPTTYGRIRWGRTSGSAGTFTILWDDIAWNDDTGPAPHNTWCGPGKTALMSPDGDITNTWTDELGATSSYLKVAKFPGAVNDTTFNVQTTTLNSVERLSLSALPAEVPSDATLRVFVAMARVGGDTTSTTTMRLRSWDESAVATIGPDTACNTAAGTYRIVSVAEQVTVDLTSPAKTKAQLANWSVGYENITELATRDRRVTALWVNVEWLESSGAPPPADTPVASAGSRSIGVFSPRGTTQPAPSGWA